jgi:probable HAF family extracellular repeat protein
MLLRSLFRRQGWNAAQGQEVPSRRVKAPPQPAKPRARVVPRLEYLEDRRVLSYVFHNLTDDPGAGTGPNQGTQPNAINNSGEIVGFYFDASGVRHSYLQIGSQYTTIDPPNESTVNPSSLATGINAEGQIVGGYHGTDGGRNHGYLLSGGQYTPIDDPLAVHGTHGTRAFGISAAGQIVGSTTFS